jgi:hypothetical protein
MSEGLPQVIDLGEARWDVDALPARRWVRPWPVLVAALVVAAAVLALGGAAPATWRLGPPLWTLPSNPAMVVIDGVLFTWEPDGAFVARDLATGTPRWRMEGVLIGNVGAVAPGVLAVGVGGEQTDAGPATPPTVRYMETTTGRELRTLPGWPLLVPTGDPDVVLTEQTVSCGQTLVSDGPEPGLWSCTDLVAWSLRTGAQRWRLPYDSAADRFYSLVDPRGSFVVITHDGDLTLRDLTTGAVEGGRRIAGWRPSTEPYGYQPVELASGTMYTAYQAEPGGPVIVSALALEPGGSEWTRSLPPHVYAEAQGALSVASCNRWLCLFDGGGTWLLDPATGEPVRGWTTQEGLGTVGFGLLSQTALPGTGATVTTLSEERTGRVVAAVHGDLQVLSDQPGPHGALVALINHTWRAHDIALVYPNGTVALIGVVEDIDACITSADLLICTGAVIDVHGDVQSATRAWRLSR